MTTTLKPLIIAALHGVPRPLDQTIARDVGCHSGYVAAIRLALGTRIKRPGIRAEVVAMSAAGMLDSEIATSLGTSRRNVAQHRRRSGTKLEYGKPWTPGEIRRIQALRKLGYVSRQIAVALGRTPSSVRNKMHGMRHRTAAKPHTKEGI